jgi:hypothetical protein
MRSEQNRDLLQRVRNGSPAVVGGFTIDDFEISPDHSTMTCPAGATVELRNGRATFARHCQGCELRSLCTTAQAGRTIALHPDHDLLAAARRQAATAEFDRIYRNKRPMVERSLAWFTRGTNRRLRFRGIERNRLGWAHRCAAINLQRLLTLGLTAHHHHAPLKSEAPGKSDPDAWRLLTRPSRRVNGSNRDVTADPGPSAR